MVQLMLLLWMKPGRLWPLALALLLGAPAFAKGTSGAKEIPYDRLAETGVTPKTFKVVLDPTRGWTNSNVFVKEGDLVAVSASGLVDPGVRIMRGPEGQGRDPLKEMVHECAYVALLMRIGDGQPICVGPSATYEIVEGGPIYFHVNELESLRFDDSGHFDITIQVVPAGDAVKKEKQDARPLTAVLDVVPVNISQADAVVLSGALRGQVAATGKYVVLDRSGVDQNVRKMHLSRADLADPGTAARLGKASGAQKVVTCQIGRIGASYSVTLQLINADTGQVENTVVEVYKCSREELPEKLALAAAKL